jgi:DNA polymerase III delta prime subunit
MLESHSKIKNKLNHFIEIKKIPNIIFYGPQGSGKKTIVENFLNMIYKDTVTKSKYILYANCGNHTGIKFIRDELKFFSKSNINNKSGMQFKSVVLLNADKLTNDAQSALRRCIEVNSHHTRFFIIVENCEMLLKPIISRFCSIYVPLPKIGNSKIDFYNYKIDKIFNNSKCLQNKKLWLQKRLNNLKDIDVQECKKISNELYQKGYNFKYLFNYLENSKNYDEIIKYKLLTYFDKIRLEFRNEELFIFNFLYFIFMRPNEELENVLII